MRVIWYTLGIVGIIVAQSVVNADKLKAKVADVEEKKWKEAEQALLYGKPTAKSIEVANEKEKEVKQLAETDVPLLVTATVQHNEEALKESAAAEQPALVNVEKAVSASVNSLLDVDGGAAHENESKREARQFRTFGFGRPFGFGGFGRPFYGGGFGRPFYGGGFGRPFYGGGFGRPFYGGGFGRPFYGGFGRPFYGRPCCFYG